YSIRSKFSSTLDFLVVRFLFLVTGISESSDSLSVIISTLCSSTDTDFSNSSLAIQSLLFSGLEFLLRASSTALKYFFAHSGEQAIARQWKAELSFTQLAQGVNIFPQPLHGICTLYPIGLTCLY